MALRLVEVTLPTSGLPRVPVLVKDLHVIDLWMPAAEGDEGRARMLVDARDTEALSDAFTREFGHHDPFRMVFQQVEATIPAVEEPEPAAEPLNAKKGPRRISREELYEDIAEATALTPVFVTMVALSTVVAAVGLLGDDVAILIGAMVIAPLLGPNIALSLASTLGDVSLAGRSLRSIAVGVSTAFALAFVMGMMLEVDPATPEIASRTHAGLEDVALALAAGAAGALAYTTGVPAVVVGVMVAVALLPPLVVTGLLLGAGHYALGFGALMLVIANVTCLNLAAVATFLAQRVRPRTWWEAERARRATWIAVTTWAVMLAILVLLIVLRQQRVA